MLVAILVFLIEDRPVVKGGEIMLTTDVYSVLGEHRAGHFLKQFPATAQPRADDFLAEVLRTQTFVSEQIPRLLGPGSGSGSDLAGLLATRAHIVRRRRFSDHQQTVSAPRREKVCTYGSNPRAAVP